MNKDSKKYKNAMSSVRRDHPNYGLKRRKKLVSSRLSYKKNK